MKKKKKRRFDHHHIIPQSRDRKKTKDPNNIVRVRKDRHSAYHFLFSNRTPQEIIKLLVDEFWDGKWYFVYNACNEQRLYP